MQTRRIIEGAAFGPETLHVAGAAFDAAWSEVADRFDTSTAAAARDVLATSIISAAREDSFDVEMLRRVGLASLTRIYPERLARSSPREAEQRREN